MNCKYLSCLASVMVCLAAGGRMVRPWSDTELQNAADTIVIACPVDTRDLDETNALGFTGTPAFQPKFRGVETTFKVLDVFKGMPPNDRILLHHYRFETGWGSPPNGPTLVDFPASGTNQFLLYLVKDGPGRYAPAAGQMDVGLSMKAATNLPANFRFGFPMLLPIADADPAVRNPVVVPVPTRLKIERTADVLSAVVDTNSFEPVELTVGTNMVTGVTSECYIYPADGARPAGGSVTGMGGSLEFRSAGNTWRAALGGIPAPGKHYIVEIELIAFETDIPPQHMWSPYGKKYKILWQRTLKQVVE